MNAALEINGKNLVSIKEASEQVSYSRDYVTRLAREEKIVASLVGRQWFVDVDSLRRYAEASAIEQGLRKKMLSEERKNERVISDSVAKQKAQREKRAQGLHMKSLVVASCVLSFGLLTGWATNFMTTPQSVVDSVYAQQKSVMVPASHSQRAQAIDANDAASAQPVDAVPFNEVVVPSVEVTEMDVVSNGFLLLPQSTTTDITELFSDEVVVTQSTLGDTSVVRVDAEGNQVGGEIPFVEVPVTHVKPVYE